MIPNSPFQALLTSRKVCIFIMTQSASMLVEFKLDIYIHVSGRQFPAAPWSGSALNWPLLGGQNIKIESTSLKHIKHHLGPGVGHKLYCSIHYIHGMNGNM